ncbi:MAG: cytochrome c biogenesis protein CcdA [Pseudomonadota bacterium]
MVDGSALGLASAFAAGIVSFLSPCVLPLVPAYLSYVSGHSVEFMQRQTDAHSRAEALALSGFFVAGFSAVFIALGASATALGRLLLQYRYEANIAGGIIIVIFGLAMLGMMRGGSWFYRDIRFHPRLRGGRPAAALVLGLAFGFGWTPCIGPVLGAILTVSAAQSTGGVALLSAYALGLGVPFVLSAAFAKTALGKLKAMRRLGAALQAVAGVILIVMGIAMATGWMTRFSYWLLEMFPVLGRIG